MWAPLAPVVLNLASVTAYATAFIVVFIVLFETTQILPLKAGRESLRLGYLRCGR